MHSGFHALSAGSRQKSLIVQIGRKTLQLEGYSAAHVKELLDAADPEEPLSVALIQTDKDDP